MKQAIVTKFLGATDNKGSRIKATAYAVTITVEYKHELDAYENHRLSAMALAQKYGWDVKNDYFGGSMPTEDGYVFVAVEKKSK